MKSFLTFAASSGSHVTWPIPLHLLSGYISWAGSTKGLKASTVSAYLSSLKFLHVANGVDPSAFFSPKIGLLLKGLANLEIYSGVAPFQRSAMNLSVLKLLGHALAQSGLPSLDKKALWACFCLAFYGSLRMGEILCSRSGSFDSVDSFLWSDISWVSSDHIVLHLRNTKTAKQVNVDLFSIPSCSSCPVAALAAFHRKSNNLPSAPVFVWSSGLCITVRDVNSWLLSLLNPLLGPAAAGISAHSFRAAIPSLLASFPEDATSLEIMQWGRWQSGAYLSYTKSQSAQRRKIFNKIVLLLDRRSRGAHH